MRLHGFFALPLILSLLTLPCLCSRELPGVDNTDSCKDSLPSHDGLIEAEPDSRPWMTLLWVSCERLADSDNSTERVFKTCEGALVRGDWILTAATCFQECRDVGLASVTVDIGLQNSNIRDEVANGRMNAERISVKKIYSSKDAIFENGFGDFSEESFAANVSVANHLVLLRLSASVKDHNRIILLSACTNPSFELDGSSDGEDDMNEGSETGGTSEDGGAGGASEGSECLVSSWGGLMSSAAGALQDMRLRALHRGECGIIGHGDSSLVTGGLLCVTESASKQFTSDNDWSKMVESFRLDCVVQQGTPLVISEETLVQEEDGMVESQCGWRLLGLLSFGMGCHGNSDVTHSDQSGEAGNYSTSPGFFVSVCPHLSWIESTIEQDNALTAATAACPVLPTPPPNGYICNRRGATPSRVEVCCERGYVLEGRSVYECDRGNRRWKPAKSPKCVPVTCPLLLAPPHGHTHPDTCNSSTYQTTCWVSCEHNYTLSHGDGLMTCTADGTWSQTPPSCIPVDCGPPPSAGSLEVAYSSTLIDSIATYACSQCYEMVGGAGAGVEVVCGSDGKWMGSKPACSPVYCPSVTPPTFGFVHSTSLQCGAQVRYSCQPGTNLIGQPEAECLSNGDWSAPAPQCVSVACDAPMIAGSNYASESNATYSYESVISVGCDACRVMMVEGVRREEGENLTCAVNGKWDKPLPTCQWVTCPLPSFLDNGTIEPLGQLYFCATTVSFSCDKGYRLNGTGTNTSTCTQNGTWTNEFPTCEKIHCSPPPRPKNHTHFCGSKVTQYLHSMVSYCCDKGYQFESGMRTENVRCGESGNWNGTVPKCKPITCSAPSLPAGVVIARIQLGYALGREYDYSQISSKGYRYGTRLTLGCAGVGHSVKGDKYLTCEGEGQWDHPLPTCEATSCSVACEMPHPPRNGRIVSVIRPGVGIIPHNSLLTERGALIGDVAVFVCSHGYYLHGSGSRRCGSNRVWSGQAPHCLSSCVRRIS